jgi:hypothetical protein
MKVLFVLLVGYGLLVAGFFVAMCQRPAVFASVMARAPNLTFMILPFRPMWMRARAGRLSVGDEAPGFALETYDRQSRVRLSDSRGKRPVVLVFGSYT